MGKFPNTLVDKLWFLFVGVLIVVSLFLLAFIVSPKETSKVQAKSAAPTSSVAAADLSDSPNVVTSGMAMMAFEVRQTVGTVADATSTGVQSASSATIRGGKAFVRSTQAVATATARGLGRGVTTAGQTAGKGVVFVGNTFGKGAMFVIHIPAKVLESATNVTFVRSVIRPSDSMEVPIIDPNSPALREALTALPPTKDTDQASIQGNSGPLWPIHGEVTTQFGVPHWPYQSTHSGLDISDGLPSGVTPIKPFRPGRVIDVVHSSYGLGNHVIVDHGNGVTSVYAHMASISVKEGQTVELGTTLGYEGSTGASTGTHLHFEIRVHGQAADPHQFITGQP